MKKSSKIFAILLTLVMIMSFAVITVAAEEPTANAPAPTHSKVVKDNGDGTFDVTLSVTGSVDTQSGTEASAASDIVLVVDNSGSIMYDWDSVESAVDVMMTTILKPGSTNNVAVVGYGSDAWIEDFNGSYWTNSKDDVMAAMTAMDDWGLTNASDALDKTAQVLGTARAGAPKYIVFLSDGYPDSEREALESLETLTGTYPDTTIYSVGVNGSDEDFMISVAGSEANYFYAGDADELAKVFGDIAVSIEKSYKDVVVTETVNDYAEVVGSVTFAQSDFDDTIVAEAANVFDKETNSISWAVNDLKTLSAGTTYTMTYTVKASQKAIDEFSSTGYPNTGDENTDADAENITSSGKKGFFFSSATIAYNYNDVDATDVFANPVIQVPNGTPAPTSPKTGTQMPIAPIAIVCLLPLAALFTIKCVKRAK